MSLTPLIHRELPFDRLAPRPPLLTSLTDNCPSVS
jgi:hypothetical protein